jgi:hypothetical protein
MTELRLRGREGGLVTTTDAWNDVLALAEDFGWRPEQRPSLYRADVGLQVTARDADNLASSLRRIANHISTNEPDIDEARRDRILRDLSRIIEFCGDGEFRIC